MKAWLCMNTIQTIIRIFLYSTVQVQYNSTTTRRQCSALVVLCMYSVHNILLPQVFKQQCEQTYVTVTNLVEGFVTGSGIFMYLYNSVHEPMYMYIGI